MEFVCRIQQSAIEIDCKVEKFSADKLADIHRRALDISRAQVNLIAFKMGFGLTVVLDSYTASDGVTRTLLFQDSRLPDCVSAIDLSDGFAEMCQKIIEQPLLQMALNELILSISTPHVALVECARAMDRLKHLVADPDQKDGPAWRQLREALQISEQYLKFITDHSTGPRHGRPGHTSGQVVSEVTRRSWVVLNRYFELLKRGAKQLPLSEFPLLQDS
jgi:hypothetical protein